jgi:hypothetical protein
MYKPEMKAKLLSVLSPESTAPQEHKDLAALCLKYLATWEDRGHPEMGDYLTSAVWEGISSLREIDGKLERVTEINPKAPEFNPKNFTHTVTAMPSETAPASKTATAKVALPELEDF